MARAIATHAATTGEAFIFNGRGTAGYDGELNLSSWRLHRLDAARDARRQAEGTFLSGEREASRRWLRICSLLGGRSLSSRNPHPAATR